MKKWFIRSVVVLLLLAAVSATALISIDLYVGSFKTGRLHTSIDQVPTEEPPRVAIVFGASVYPNGALSPVLRDRVETAVDLYKAGKVKKLRMSGDMSAQHYDEPTAMKEAAVSLGVPENDIVMDFAGRRTYDTCYRAREIFAVKKAVLVAQDFHQARALYLCNNMGVDSIGIAADRFHYLEENYWRFREFFSVISAWLEMNFVPFTPIGGAREPIEP
jgi:SanA protein